MGSHESIVSPITVAPSLSLFTKYDLPEPVIPITRTMPSAASSDLIFGTVVCDLVERQRRIFENI